VSHAASRAPEPEPLARAARWAGREILTGHEAKGLIEPACRVALDVVRAEGVDQHVARRRAPAQLTRTSWPAIEEPGVHVDDVAFPQGVPLFFEEPGFDAGDVRGQPLTVTERHGPVLAAVQH
jgi:hypothetical protein